MDGRVTPRIKSGGGHDVGRPVRQHVLSAARSYPKATRKNYRFKEAVWAIWYSSTPDGMGRL